MVSCPPGRADAADSAAGRSLLILACGNPSRGDDALGPALIERLALHGAIGADLLWDFQLQIEHALDLEGRTRVVFVDAAASGAEPFAFNAVESEQAVTVTTHAMSPGALLRVYDQVARVPAPACWLLAIRGYHFQLGDGLSARAGTNLAAAEVFLTRWLSAGSGEVWRAPGSI